MQVQTVCIAEQAEASILKACILPVRRQNRAPQHLVIHSDTQIATSSNSADPDGRAVVGAEAESTITDAGAWLKALNTMKIYWARAEVGQ